MDQVRYHFTDSRGKVHAFDMRDYSGLRDKELEIPVIYDSENPKHVVINTARDRYGWALGWMVVGLWLLLFGYLSVK